ncbi:DUF2946 family protein [Ostreiculturibacter nitratireducens]|uniref:DUF2946 family protein n=1 Tax=Ostreiculturibacter nitratireducens TaxID=3075226 RepID=UPI0031B5A79C
MPIWGEKRSFCLTHIKVADAEKEQFPRMYRRICHLLTFLLLASSLTLSGLAEAVAGVEMNAFANSTTKVVLCSGDGAITITIDDQGNPVEDEPQHECRTCAFCLSLGAAALTPGEAHPSVPASFRHYVWPARRPMLHVRTWSSHPARAPPRKSD